MNYSLGKQSKSSLLAALILYLAIIQIIFGLGIHLRSGLIDFAVYHSYGNILLSGNSPYGAEFTEGIPFNYPPSSFLVFAPFSLLPELPSSILFTGISLLLFLSASYSLLKLVIKNKTIRFLLLTLLFQNFPLKFTLVTGQVNLIVLTFLSIAFIFDHKKRPVLSGLAWGMAAAIKLTPISLLFYYLLTKKYKSLITGLILFALTNLLILTLSPGSFYYLYNHLPSLLGKSGSVTTLYDQSLRAFLARLGINFNVFLSLIVVFIMFIFTAWKHYYRKPLPLRNLILFSQILIITAIGNAFAWQHHFVLTFPAFIAATKIALNKKSWIYWSLLLLSAVLVGMHYKDIAHPPTTNPFLISHTLMGSLILFFLLLKS